MAETPPRGQPRITPYLLYEDCAAAIDWLTKAFGFRETVRFADEEGVVTHAELRLEDGVVFLGHPSAD
jgi:PhnB protein